MTVKYTYGRQHVYSAAYKLFNMFWLAVVPCNEMMDVNDFEFFGVCMSGDTEWDSRLATAPGTYQLSPARMAQLVAEGVDVQLVDPKDATTIYNLILEHLKDWRDALEDGCLFSFDDVPLEGLKEFNQLAAVLVPVARCYGLVDDIVTPGINNEFKRTFSVRTRVQFQAKDARHSDHIFTEIAIAANKLGQRINWRSSELDQRESKRGAHHGYDEA